MNRDSDLFSDEGQRAKNELDTAAQSVGSGSDVPEDLKYFLDIIGYLRDMFEGAGSVPFSSRKLVDTDKCMRMLDELYNTLPYAIRCAQELVAEKDRLLSKAETDANNAIALANARITSQAKVAAEQSQRVRDEAQKQADQLIQNATAQVQSMLDESEIVKAAYEEARRITNEARSEANERRMEAANFADRLLSELDNNAIQVSNFLRAKRKELSEK